MPQISPELNIDQLDLQIIHQLTMRHGSLGLRDGLAVALRNYAELLMELGQHADAEPYLRNLIVIRQQLASELQRPEAEIDFVSALYLHANVLTTLRRPNEAFPVLQRGLAILDRLVNQDGQTQYAADLAKITGSCGEALVQLGFG